jgi:hypothetical protein
VSNIVLGASCCCCVCGYGSINCWTVFFYMNLVKFGSARKCLRKFRRKFLGITVPSTADIHKLMNKVGYTGSLLEKKRAENTVCSPKINYRVFYLWRRREPVGTFPDKPSSVAEKLRAVLPASNSELRVFLVTNTCYYCDCSCIKSQKMFNVTSLCL